MTINPGESASRDNSESERKSYHIRDVLSTHVNPQLFEGNSDAENHVEEYVHTAEDLLARLETESKDRQMLFKNDADKVLQMLDAAIAITNDPYARELRKNLLLIMK